MGKRDTATDPTELADRLHAVSIRLLRRLRREDEATGLSAPRASALSVVVFAGPLTLGELAAAEQVKPPTMSRLVSALEADGLVRREPDPDDRRAVRVRATARGRRLLERGRRRRIAALAGLLADLPADERATVAASIVSLENVFGRRAAQPDGGSTLRVARSK